MVGWTHLRYCLVLFACLAALVPAVGAPMRIVLAEYPPYSWLDGEGVVRGIEPDILREALEHRLGQPITVEVLPWVRAQLYVEQGKADAFVAFPTERRRSYTKVSDEAVADWSVAIFVWRDHPRREALAKVTKVADLASYHLGVTDGNSWADQELHGMDVAHAPTVGILLRMLVSGHLDVIPDSPPVVHYYLREQGLKAEVVELANLEHRGLHLCVAAKSSFVAILPRFDEAIRSMRQDGEMARLLARYE
jgi:polar amino acid transport system substrate-binding protein